MNSFTVQMELCPEDRARLDKILAALETSGTPFGTIPESPVEQGVTDNTVGNKTPEAPIKPQATKDDIRKLVVSISAKGKEAKAAAREVVTKYAETITDLPEDKLDEIHAALSALTGGAK